MLRRLAPLPIEVIFDAGANVGNWSANARALFADASIHAFEINPQTYRELSKKNDFVSVNCGLSDEETDVDVYSVEGEPCVASLFKHPLLPGPAQHIRGRVIRGDSYMRENNIDRISFLKIDAEGAEYKILSGFSEAFNRRTIDIVQFEYGRINIVIGKLLRDFYAFFEKYGFVVGKIYPGFVDFKDYSLADEDFRGPNYVACRRDLREYVVALAGRQ